MIYTQLAEANGIAEDLIPDVGRIFSEEWQKSSKPGWWIEVEKGKWEKKPEKPRGARGTAQDAGATGGQS